VLAVVALLVVSHQLGILEKFADPARVKQTLIDLGPRGYLAFVLAYAALQPFGMPGTVFIMAAPLIWPWQVAFGLSMTGTMSASVIGFSFARFVARDWISPRIPERFQKYNNRLGSNAFSTVFLLRLVFWMPPLLHAFFGVSKVRFSTHFWGSLAGYILPLFLVSYFGEQLFEMMRNLPAIAWIAMGILIIGFMLTLWRRSAIPTS
jgi:uncharacterized membrane protein YdjX (TVP38/TMEM64 family)